MRYIFISLLFISTVSVAQKRTLTAHETDSINKVIQYRIDSVNSLQTDSLGVVYSFTAHEADWQKLFYVIRYSKALTGDKIEDMIEEIRKNLKPVPTKK